LDKQWRGNRGIDRGGKPDRCITIDSGAEHLARRVRKRLGLTQLEFSQRIDVSLDTIRNWEQGKRCPTGAAKALLKILDKAPESALLALR
jgi:putative transcriptional regulator